MDSLKSDSGKTPKNKGPLKASYLIEAEIMECNRPALAAKVFGKELVNSSGVSRILPDFKPLKMTPSNESLLTDDSTNSSTLSESA